MSPRRSFLDLPPEVRCLIYHEYFTIPGGYVHDFESECLRDANGESIPIALLLTCKLIAQEARGIPLQANTITFSTVHFNYANIAAMRFSTLLDNLFDGELSCFKGSIPLLDTETCTRVGQKFPDFKPTLDRLFEATPLERVEQAKELLLCCPTRQAITYTLQLLAERYGTYLAYEIAEVSNGYFQKEDPIDLLPLCHEPWAIPSWKHLNEMGDIFSERDNRCHYRLRKRTNNQKYRFSAAAAAIFFLGSIPSHTRQDIRKIILNENNRSVPYPECHGRGLIPFCKENPHLRIERRVNLWTNIFQQGSLRHFEEMDEFPQRHSEALAHNDIMYYLTQWLTEALALVSAGMPPDSFVLVLDGDPVPDLCSEIFQNVIHRNLAYARVRGKDGGVDRLGMGRIEPESLLMNIYWKDDYFVSLDYQNYADLHNGIQNLINHNPMLRCNFNPGEELDLTPVIEETSDWSWEDWIRRSAYHEERFSEPVAPLPKWEDLINENLYSEEEMKAMAAYGKQIGII